jgi:hypothetical protein
MVTNVQVGVRSGRIRNKLAVLRNRTTIFYGSGSEFWQVTVPVTVPAT